jgi:pSer/pThr/pTyr-binding forkhead associated (FHA) protein
MSIRLSCVDAVSTLDDTRLDKLPATLGRGDEADVCIHDTWASRVHCRLFARGGQLFVEDLGSSNGTMVNGERVSECPLDSGDQLTVGITTFRVHCHRLPKNQDVPVGHQFA